MIILDIENPNYKIALVSLEIALKRANLRPTRAPYPPDRNFVPISEWRRQFYVMLGPSVSSKARIQRFQRARAYLQGSGITRELGDSVWNIYTSLSR